MHCSITRRSLLTRGLSLAGFCAAGLSPLAVQSQESRTADPRFKNLAPGQTPIRQAINIKRQNGEHPEEMIRRARAAGYTAVKGARHPGGNIGEPWNSMTTGERDEVVAACRKFDVIIYEVGGYTNLLTPDTKQLRENMAQLAHCLEVAESVACPMVGTVAGSRDPSSLINVHPENWTSSTWNLLVRNVKQVLRDTSGMRAGLGMEAQVTTIIDSPRAHLRLLEDVGDERLTVNLDPVNMMTLERYYHTTELLNECFDLLGERITGCHAKDTLILPDRQTICIQEICPGKGVLDYETYLVRMSRLAWPRALEPEHIADEEYPEAKAYIAGVAARIGVKIY